MLRSTSVLQLFIYVVVYSADSDFNSHPLRSYEYRLSEKTHYGHLFEATDFNFEVLLNDLGDGGIQLVFSQPEDTAKGLDGLEDWFSFKRDEKGVVTKVLYSSRSSSEVLMRKKAVAGILSMSLELDQSSYSVVELDHTGKHEAHYSIQHASEDVAIITKKSAVVHAAFLIETTKVTTMSLSNKTLMAVVMTRTVKPLSDEELGSSRFSQLSQPDDLFSWNSVITEGLFPKFREMKSEMMLILEATRPLSETISLPSNLLSDQLVIELQIGTRVSLQELRQRLKEDGFFVRNVDEALQQYSENEIETLVKEFVENWDGQVSDSLLALSHGLMYANRPAISAFLCYVLLSPVTTPDAAIRLLTMVATAGKIPSQRLLDSAEALAFQLKSIPEELQKPEVQQQAMLTLGSLIHKIQSENLSLAKRLSDRLTNELTQAHRKGMFRNDASKYESARGLLLIDSIGNIGTDLVLDHLLQLVNGSVTVAPSYRRAATLALRKYNCTRSADTLRATAMLDSHASVRKTAANMYRKHQLREESWVIAENDFVEGGSRSSSSEATLSRGKRSLLAVNPLQDLTRSFKLSTPSVNWHKRLGSDDIGADFGTSASNKMELTIDPWKSDFSADMKMKSWVNAKLGYLNLDVELLDVDTCFNGNFGYDVNVMKSYQLGRLQEEAEEFDHIADTLASSIHSAAVHLADRLAEVSQADSILKIFDHFKAAVEQLPSGSESVEQTLTVAVSKSRLYAGLPLSGNITDVLSRFRALHSSIKGHVLELYHSVLSAAAVDLPFAAHEIDGSLDVIQSSLQHFHMSPQQAMDEILHSNLRIKAAVVLSTKVKESLDAACSVSADDCGSWLTLAGSTGELENDINSLASELNAFSIDTTNKNGIGVTVLEQQLKAYSDLSSLFSQSLIAALSDLQSSFAPFQAAYVKLDQTVASLESTSNELRQRYEQAKGEVDRIFGIHFDHRFPKSLRQCNDTCGCGLYPTTTDGKFSEPGIDLVTKENEEVVSPFSGLIRLSNSSDLSGSTTWALQLFPSDFSLSNYEILIDNIIPVASLSRNLQRMKAGEPLGRSRGNGGCSSKDFIHVIMKQRSDSQSESLYIDPSGLLQPVRSPQVTSSVECNDYTVIYKGEVVKRGALISNSNLEHKNLNLIRSGGRQSLSNIKSSFANTDQPSDGTSQQNLISEQLDKYQWSTATSGILPIYPKSWNDPVDVVAPSAAIDSLTVTEVNSILKSAGSVALLEEFGTTLSQLITIEATKRCYSLSEVTISELQVWLLEMGRSASGSRQQLIARLLMHPSQGCPGLELSLIQGLSHVYSIEDDCSSITACILLQYGFANFPTLLTVKHNPCGNNVTFMIGSWSNTIASSMNFSFEVDVNATDQVRVYLEGNAIVSDKEIVVTLTAQLCHPNTLDCSPSLSVLNQSIFDTLCNPESTANKTDLDSLTLRKLDSRLRAAGVDPLKVTEVANEFRAASLTQAIGSTSELRESFVSEFPQPYDLIMEETQSFLFSNETFFEYQTSFVVSTVPVTFQFGAKGYYAVAFDVSFSALGKELKSTLTTSILADTYGYARQGNLQYSEVSISGKLIEARYPTYVNASFSRWPLVVGSNMDLTLASTNLLLTTKTIRDAVSEKRTIYSKDLWSYQTPPIDLNMFVHTNQISDKSPPIVSSIFSNNPDIEMDTRLCYVRQLPGRSNRDPAYEIAVHVSDDISSVKKSYYIGRIPGENDVLMEQTIRGLSLTVAGSLVNNVRLYFTVVAENLEGMKSYGVCELPSYDVSLPTGWILPSYTLTSHPSDLSATIMVAYNSPLQDAQLVAVGLGAGQYGDQQLAWSEFATAELSTEPDTSLDPLNGFGSSQNGRLPVSPAATSMNVMSADLCAQECLALEEPKCLSFDYNEDDKLCLLYDSVLQVGLDLAVSDGTQHYIRLGAGNTLEMSWSNFNLEHNRLYHINVKVTNKLGYMSTISSKPILVDLTPPSPGPIRNAVLDEEVSVGCPTVFADRCIKESPLSKGRRITDGPESETVFLGQTSLEEVAYSKATHYIAANWDGFHDDESGIYGYTWCVGSSLGACDVYAESDPQQEDRETSDLTHVGLAYLADLPSPVELEHGKKYYVTVSAVNNVVHGGALVTTVRHSTPLVIDTTPPVIEGVRVELFNSTTGFLLLQLNASDAESGLANVYVGLGSSKREVDLVRWTAVNYTGAQVKLTVDVADGQATYTRVKVTNRVELTATSFASQPLVIDHTGPTVGLVNDGQSDDIDFQNDTNEICANWKGFGDPHSGISGYKVGVGTRAGALDVLDLTEVDSFVDNLCFKLSLQHRMTYYTTVVAIHGGVDMINSAATSDGVLVDTTDPVGGIVQDGSNPAQDVNITSDSNVVAATWNGFSDPDSGIARYKVEVKTQGKEEAFSKVVGSDSLPSSSDGFEWTHIHFDDGDRVLVSVTAVNGAEQQVTRQSDGFLVDTTPPLLVYLRDGLDAIEDVQYQTNRSQANAIWELVDVESGVEYHEVSLLQLKSGSRMRVWPPVTLDGPIAERLAGNATSWTKTSLELVSGGKYIVTVTAVNKAGLMATHETDGFIVDDFPPQVLSVDVLPSGQDASDVLVDDRGNIVISSTDTIQCRWSGFDDETKIVEYLLDVVEDPGNVSVTTNGMFVSMGLRTTAIVDGLNLTIGDSVFGPFYRVYVKAVDASGNVSPEMKSKRIRVSGGDSAGTVRDGPDASSDIEFQRDTTSITATFDGFISESCEVDRYEWAIGYSGSEIEALQPFTTIGLMVTNEEASQSSPGAGRAQALLPSLAETTRVLYVTVRAVTMCSVVLEATSNGVRIDTTPADISFLHVGTRAAGNVGAALHHNLASALSVSWKIRETESRQMGAAQYRLGTYPGGDDLQERTLTVDDSIGDGTATRSSDGLPHYFTVSVWNEAGWKSETTSNAIVYDTSRPTVGTVSCPSAVLSANDTVTCSWWGFWDAESGLDYVEYAVGYHRGDTTLQSFTRLPHTASSVTVKNLNFDINREIYVSLKVTNLVSLTSMGYSNAIQVDSTAPLRGSVQVLSDVGRIDFNGSNTTERLAGGCVTLTDYLHVKWYGFRDDESSIVRYEVGLGTRKGTDDVVGFTSLSANASEYVFRTLDLSGIDHIYVTVRAFNFLCLYSSVVSEKMRVAPSLQPTDSFINDGSNRGIDAEYVDSVYRLTAVWSFGDVCPAVNSEWKIESIDPGSSQTYSSLNPDSSGYYQGSNNQLSLEDGKTYRVVAKSTDVAGRVRVLKSNGVSLNIKPLRPGIVRDGLVAGKDIDYQKSARSISANWDVFGDKPASQRITEYEVSVGVDRRYPATRSNIVPFMSVGMNTSYTINNLELTARTVRYYFTVRAHSVSGATAEATSDGVYVGYVEGIAAGTITLNHFQSSTTDITAHWTAFESENPIQRYDFAVGTAKHNRTMLLSFCDDSDRAYSSQFDVAGFQSVSIDTGVTLSGISLQHGLEYFVTVRAVDRAGHCVSSVSDRGVIIDTTVPQRGYLLAGFDAEMVNPQSIDDSYLEFSTDSSHITVTWWNFTDNESGIESYTIGLYQRIDCGNSSSRQSLTDFERASKVVENIVLSGGVELRQSHTFSGLNLSSTVAYSIHMEVRNEAGLKTVVESQPVVIDTGDPVGGDVKDGGDWSSDRVYQSRTDRMEGVITHSLVKPMYDGDSEVSENPCPLSRHYRLNGSDNEWSKLVQSGLLGIPSPMKQNLEYRASQVQSGPLGTNITLIVDTGSRTLLSGAYSATIDASLSGTSVSFSLRAARGTQGLASYAITSAVFWNGPVNSVGDFALNTSSTAYTAVGMQLRPAYSISSTTTVPAQLILWSRFANDSADVQTITLDQTSDLTSSFNEYSFLFEHSQTESSIVEHSVVVKLNGARIAVMHGIPFLSFDTRLIFHAWNRDGKVPPVDKVFDPPIAVMYVRDVKVSRKVNGPCAHGSPFYDWTAPFVEFQAAVGSRPLLNDVVEFRSISRPCRACVDGPCGHHGCERNCSRVGPREISFSLDNLTLWPYSNRSVIIGIVDPTLPPIDTSYNQPATYFLTVKAIAASGRAVIVSSNGVVIDVTRPLLVSIDHIDTAWKANEPATYQKSNSTIAARWKFHDPESFISEYRWAIGGSYASSDIQSFRSVGLKTFAANSSLEGIIQDNMTYYASVIAINGAGLSTVAHSVGVTYVARPLNDTLVRQSVDYLFSESLVENENVTVRVDIVRSRFTETLGISWSVLSGQVDTIYWIIGTREGMDDILPEIEVNFAGGSDAIIDTDSLILAGRAVGDVSELIARAKGEDPDAENSFRLEPGRVSYHTVRVCDLSHQCVDVVLPSIAVIRDQDALVTSVNGEDLAASLKNYGANSTITNVTRVVDEHYQIEAETSRGMEEGGSLAMGFLSFDDLTVRYSPEVPFVSNPYVTMLETARHLAGRFTQLSGPSFYVTVVGQDELQGPLKLNVSFSTELEWNGAYPELLYWDYNSNRWIEVSASCGIENSVNYDEGYLIAYMCSRTPIGSVYARSRRRRADDNSTSFPSTNATSFLSRETQFAVARILNYTVNTKPNLILPAGGITVREGVGTGTLPYSLSYTDLEKDKVEFSLTSLPRLGKASITADGHITYTPCADCIGTDTVGVQITEIPFGDNSALSDGGVLTVTISNVNDAPSVFFFGDGRVVDSSTSVTSYVEANRTGGFLAARIGAYDFDGIHDDLKISLDEPRYGSVNASVWLDAVGPSQAFPVDWHAANLSAGYFIGDLTFIAANLLYKPDNQHFTGDDEFRVSVEDGGGLFSAILVVKVTVLPNLCQNDGLCGGSASDPNCTDNNARLTSFDGYTCECLPGFNGSLCEIEINPDPGPVLGLCPDDVPIVYCDKNPCDDAHCPSHRNAVCRPNYCGSCTAEWFVGTTQVKCSASGTGVCDRPVNSSVIGFCFNVDCPCPREEIECPADSVYFQRRTSDCCVEWECKCPSFSCPYSMSCGDGIQPNAVVRGHGSPGWCCPNFEYEDVDECLLNTDGCSRGCQNTPYSYYCTCPDGMSLAEDKMSCGVCKYDGREYKHDDRAPFEGESYWCTCGEDASSLERWHCLPAPDTAGCFYNGLEYTVMQTVEDYGVVWTCKETDFGIEWKSKSDGR